jgi:uncharacterized membrane protein YdjX (TVP38/TMEM64 family)
VLLALAALGGIVAAHQLGLLEQFGDPRRATAALAALGGWGYVTFVVAYAVLQPFGVPGTVFILAAPLIWPWPLAFALSMAGTMAASVVGFSFARFVARDFVAERIPSRFRRYEDALAARGLTTVFVLRLVFWMPPLLHAFLGVSKVGFWTHFWGSLAGYAAPLFLVSFFGEKLFDALQAGSPELFAAMGAGALLLALGLWGIHRCRRRRAPREGASFAGLSRPLEGVETERAARSQLARATVTRPEPVSRTTARSPFGPR